MWKWNDGIPFSEDDLRLYEADRLARKIEDCFSDYNVSLKIRKKGYNPCCGDGFKFEVKLNYGTRIESVEKIIPTVQYQLKLPVLKAVKENGIFYLATYTSRTLSVDNDLRRILKSEEYKSAFEKMNLAHPVGVDSNGNAVICDLAKYPHAMVSGTTTSGKSTALKCLLVSLAQYSKLDVSLLIADRGAGLSMFADLPHLAYPIIHHDPNKLATVIMLLKDEMERRTNLELSDRDSFEELPYIVCIIDEFAWFIEEIYNSKKSEKVKKEINDLLRYGRHNKIHLILSIYDPKQEIAKIELGDIRVKMVFQTVNSRKSSTALGSGGAEKLNGSGEMIFNHINSSYHLQGVFIDDDEIGPELPETDVAFGAAFRNGHLIDKITFTISDEDLKRKEAETEEYIMNFTSGDVNSESKDGQEEKFLTVVLWTLSQKDVSINSIQEYQHVSNKYARMYYQKLQSFGVIGDIVGRGRREVVPKSIEEIPDDLKDFLSRYNVSDDKIMEAISKREKQ